MASNHKPDKGYRNRAVGHETSINEEVIYNRYKDSSFSPKGSEILDIKINDRLNAPSELIEVIEPIANYANK